MPRRQHPQQAFWPDPSLIPDGPKRDLAVWLRALAIQHGILTYPIIIDAAVADRHSPLHDALTIPVADLVYKARKLIAQSKIRMLIFFPSIGPTGQAYRVLVSALVNGQRQLVPTPWLVQQPQMMREVIARANSFSAAWARHGQNMIALQRIPIRQQYYRPVPPPRPRPTRPTVQ